MTNPPTAGVGMVGSTSEEGGSARWIAGLVLTGTVLLSIQGGLLRVALPAIRRDLDASISGVQAISLAGLVVACSTLVAFGRLADLIGPVRIYGWGLVVFGFGAATSLVVPDVAWLVMAQAFQGVGWSMAVAAGTALLVRSFDPAERSRAVAANHMAIAVGLAAGPAVGGVVVDRLGWRWAFAALAPAALVVAVVLARSAKTPPVGDGASFDLRGAILLGVSLVGGLSLIDGGVRDHLRPAGTAVAATTAAVALVVFVRLQLRVKDPMLDLRLFACRGFSAGLAAAFLNFVAMASNMFLLPFYLQDHRGLSPARAGLVMTVMPAAVLLTAPLAGNLADRVSPRGPATGGLALLTLAIVLMTAFSTDTPLPVIVGVLAVYGAGAGFFQSPNISAVMGSVAPDRFGVASASLATVARFGQVAGVAAAGGLWQLGVGTYGETVTGQMTAFRVAFGVLALFGVLAAVASWLRGPMEPGGSRSATVAADQAGPHEQAHSSQQETSNGHHR